MDGRRSPRRATFRTGSVIDPSGTAVTACVVREMSDTGARLELREDLELPKDFMHALADKAPRACKTVWQLSIVAGVRFDDALPT